MKTLIIGLFAFISVSAQAECTFYIDPDSSFERQVSEGLISLGYKPASDNTSAMYKVKTKKYGNESGCLNCEGSSFGSLEIYTATDRIYSDEVKGGFVAALSANFEDPKPLSKGHALRKNLEKSFNRCPNP